MARPTLTVEISFTTNPLETPVWVDVSAYVRDDAPLTIRRGRQYELDRVEAGTATMVLDNRDLRFDPTNTSSPYYPNVLPMKRIRVTGTANAVPYIVYVGFVEDWPPATRGFDGTVTIRCVDLFAYLSRYPFVTEDLTTGNGGLLMPVAGTSIHGGGWDQPSNPRIISVAGSIASCSGTVTINGLGTSGGAVSDTYTLSGTAVVYPSANDDRFASITQVTVPSNASGGRVRLFASTLFVSEGSRFMVSTVGASVGLTTGDISSNTTQSTIVENFRSEESTALDYLQTIAASENGDLYIGRDGKLTFYGRHRRLTSDTGYTFSDTGDGSEYPFESLDLNFDDALIYNDIVVQRDGGIAQRAQDVTSQEKYFRRKLSRSGLLIGTDNEAADAAQWLLLRYKEPGMRIAALTTTGDLKPSSTSMWPALLLLDIGQRITVLYHPLGGAAISQAVHIESVEHSISRAAWRVTWQLSPATSNSFLTFDDTLLGRFDYNAFAY